MTKLLNTCKDHYKTLMYLGLPIIISQLNTIIWGFTDTLLVELCGVVESAASFVYNLSIPCNIFSTGFFYRLTSVVGVFYGNCWFMYIGQPLCFILLAYIVIALLLAFAMNIVCFNVGRVGQQPQVLKLLIKPYNLVLQVFVPLKRDVC